MAEALCGDRGFCNPWLIFLILILLVVGCCMGSGCGGFI